MRDLTRDEQIFLVTLLGVVIENGVGSLAPEATKLPPAAVREVRRLVDAAITVRDALNEDLMAQAGR